MCVQYLDKFFISLKQEKKPIQKDDLKIKVEGNVDKCTNFIY